MRVKTPNEYTALVLEIGRRIVARRGVLGITRRQLATTIGLTEQALHRIETGGRGIPIWRLAQIADAIDTNMTELVSDLESTTPTAGAKPKHAATTIAVDAFNSIPDESKIVVAHLIRSISETIRHVA